MLPAPPRTGADTDSNARLPDLFIVPADTALAPVSVPAPANSRLPPALPASSSNNNSNVYVTVSKGRSLEDCAPVLVLFSVMGSVLFIGLGTKSLFDRDVPGVRTVGFVYLSSVMFVIDALLLVAMTLLMARSCRTELKRNKKWYVYSDAWYDTHMQIAMAMCGVSVWVAGGIMIYYRMYGGEDPWQWPSGYNIERWEKPQYWNTVMVVGTGARLVALLIFFVPAFRALARPGLVEVVKRD